MPSATDTSASLPVDSQTPTEMPRRAVSAKRCVPNAPDCVTMPSGPAGVGPSSRNELKVGVCPVRMLNRPRQFGPHSRMPLSRRDLRDARLHFAPVGADLGKAGGEHHDRLDALDDAGLHRLDREIGRHRDDRALDRAGDRGDVGKGLQPLHLVARRVDRV